MIKTVIIDDEEDARFLLHNLVKRKAKEELDIVGEADDVSSGVELIKEQKPDLVFLDVQMKSGTGFDLLEQIDHVNFEVIFVTAYNQYAIDAFKFSAFGYLLKPIKSTELQDVLDKLFKRFEQKDRGLDKKVKVLIENYGAKGEIEKLIIPNISGFRVLKINEIVRLDGDRNYSHFILLDGTKITTSKSLREYEELLMEHGFFRIHQSTIVSTRHIIGYVKTDGGYVEMVDKTKHKVSRSRKNEFLEKFK